jgi:hypothetical protein
LTVPGNAVQQLGLMPIQTPVLANNQNFTVGWGQWFLAVYNAIKTIPIPATNVPVNPAVVVGWQQVTVGGETYYMPLYQ